MKGSPAVLGGSLKSKPTRWNAFPVCYPVGFFVSVEREWQADLPCGVFFRHGGKHACIDPQSR
jgi:hypothetical protein